MGRKQIVKGYNMLDGIAADMAAPWTSNVTNVEQIDKLTIHIKWTAGSTGEFTIEAKNGADDAFFILPISPLAVVEVTDSEYQILLAETPFSEIRLNWIPDAGAASTVTARISMKSVGA